MESGARVQLIKRGVDDRLPAAFRRLLLIWSASVTADGIRFGALPLLALRTDPSAAAVAAVAACMSLPWLLVALPAGVLVDRLDPARVIAAANAGRAITVLLLSLAIVDHRVSIPLLCAVAFLLTAAETFADSAAQSLLVRIVPAKQLDRANARFVSSENVGLDLIGPLTAGALFVLLGWLPFVVAAVVFAPAGLAMLSLTGHRHVLDPGVVGPDGAHPVDRRPSVHRAFKAIFKDPDLRALVLTVAVMAAAIAAMEGVLVVFSERSLHLPDGLYPTLLASYSVGLLVAANLVGRLGRRVRSGPLMVGAIAAIGAALIVLGLWPHQTVAWLSFVVMGAGGGVWNVLSATRRQLRTPRHMMARVSSTFRAIGWGALPIGTAIGGAIGQRASVPSVFVIAGAVVLALGCAVAPFFLRPESPVPPDVQLGTDRRPLPKLSERHPPI